MRIAIAGTIAVTLLHSAASAQDVSIDTLKSDVATLCSKEFAGRSLDGARKAEAFLVERFKKLGLDTSVQDVPGFGRLECHNVIGIRRVGKEPTKEHIIVSAHYDHLGMANGQMYPGASDNAASVAVMLEIARLLKPIQRDVLFIGFDLEEDGFLGSGGYVKKPVRPLEECAAFLTMDILGRELADATEGALFATGLERSDTMFDAIAGVKPPEGLHLGYVGVDAIGARSDYVPFIPKKVPFVFFSTGEFPDYHRPTDTADRILYDKLRKEATLILGATRAMDTMARPKWLDKPALRIEEVSSMEVVIGQLLDNGKKLGFDNQTVIMGRVFQQWMKQVAKSGKLERHQRKEMVMHLRRLQMALR
ncbi:MAG: M28 family peptidase [Planctomycetota bacterium]